MYQKILDESSNAIYVCEKETFTTLYINKAGMQMKGKEGSNHVGAKCYEFLLERSSPCSFCNMPQLSKEFYLVRQYTSPVTNRHYVTKGKLIDWNGIDAHIEYISDETERINNQKYILELNKKLMISENLLQAVILHSGLFFLEYDVQKNCAMLDEKSQKELNLPRFVENYVEILIRKNIILPEFIEPFRKLHHDLKCGVREAEQTIRVLLPKVS